MFVFILENMIATYVITMYFIFSLTVYLSFLLLFSTSFPLLSWGQIAHDNRKACAVGEGCVPENPCFPVMLSLVPEFIG